MKDVTGRRVAYRVLTQAETSSVFLKDHLDQALSTYSLSGVDRRFVTELVYGTTKMQGHIDYFLGALSTRALMDLRPKVRVLLRLGAYQLLFLDRVPPSASVNETVQLAKEDFHQGVAGFVNGILRRLSREYKQIPLPEDPIHALAITHSHPLWLVKRWVLALGFQKTEEILKCNNKQGVLGLRTNTLKVTPEALLGLLRERGLSAEIGQYAKESILVQGLVIKECPLFAKGYYYVQDESSVLVGHALAPKPMETIYDLCSAPGGKSTHVAALMENRGLVVSMDSSSLKLEKVQENAKRLGITIIKTRVEDATNLPALPPFHRVLLDAPCSGLGVLRHRADLRNKVQEKQIKSLAAIQKKMLRQGAKLVMPGGILLYSTCTLTEEENREQIKGFLQEDKSFVCVPVPLSLPQECPYGLTVWPHLFGGDGFFISVMQRRA